MGLLTTLLLVALPLLAAGALNTPGVQGSQSAIYLPLVMAPPYYRPVTASPQRALHRDRSRHPHRSECRRQRRPGAWHNHQQFQLAHERAESQSVNLTINSLGS